MYICSLFHVSVFNRLRSQIWHIPSAHASTARQTYTHIYILFCIWIAIYIYLCACLHIIMLNAFCTQWQTKLCEFIVGKMQIDFLYMHIIIYTRMYSIGGDVIAAGAAEKNEFSLMHACFSSYVSMTTYSTYNLTWKHLSSFSHVLLRCSFLFLNSKIWISFETYF